MDDRELVKAVAKNTDKGWEIIINQYAGLLYHVVRGVLSNPADVEETVSEVFTEAFGKWDRFDMEKGSLKSFLATIAVRRAIDRSRRMKPTVELDEAKYFEESGGILEDLIRQQDKEEVLRLLTAMEEPERSMVIDRFFFRKSSRDMAALYDMTPNTVDKRISRALKALRLKLEVEVR